jgi:hypothetical protein
MRDQLAGFPAGEIVSVDVTRYEQPTADEISEHFE